MLLLPKTNIWLLAAALAVGGHASEAKCRQALALGLDVSGSVDAAEYRLQLDGLAAALTDPEVEAAFLDMPEVPARVAVFEWSGPNAQRLLLDWVEITSPDDLERAADVLRRSMRSLSEPSTALGRAKSFGSALLKTQSECWRHVLDISGDGTSNTGPRPQDVRPNGVVINALVIGGDRQETDLPALAGYFRTYVIQGADAFVETALGYDDYQAAMVRKLKRELTVLVLSRNP